MPSFNSNMGIWEPAHENVVVRDKKTNKLNIYDGPDRAATEDLEKNGGKMGMEVSRDPEVIHRARQLNMTTEQFLQLNKDVTPEETAKAKAAKDKVITHEDPTPKPAVNSFSGGKVKGGFGDLPTNLG